MNPLIMVASSGEVPTLPEGGDSSMWETITSGVGSFIDGVLTPVMNVCTTNGICLAFLSVTFVGLGVRILRRTIGAFGRGR